ncbi:MAG: protease SohB [Coxiella sp. RIFCSPHIGHO2_12_FULL_42_15]|nr:MAG: protease SohB [Coxiella sp. RIFCSPHIGHO2_12_FULL_42_15]
MDFLSNYGLFFFKLISIVIAILVVLLGVVAILSKDKLKLQAKLSVTPLNKKLTEYSRTLLQVIEDKEQLKALQKKEKRATKNKQEQARLFVLNFHGDIRASQVNSLRETITAILLIAKPKDEVLVRLESAGGMVNAYGLAASQLSRIKEAKLKLTIAVDKIAASGGYLMTCIADHIIAAPFAIIGSIGVIVQLPNFHDFLKDKNIDFEQVSAGEYKRTLTLFGENTKKGREKMQQEVEEVHALFKDHILQYRPQLTIEQVATGEYWLAQKALELQLVDELNSSDNYLLNASKKMAIYEIEYKMKKSLPQRMMNGAAQVWHSFIQLGSTKTGQDFM